MTHGSIWALFQLSAIIAVGFGIMILIDKLPDPPDVSEQKANPTKLIAAFAPYGLCIGLFGMALAGAALILR